MGWEALRSAIALAEVDGLGPAGVGRLLAAFGSPEAAMRADDAGWAEALRMSLGRAGRLRRSAIEVDADATLRAHESLGMLAVTVGCADYPALLAVIPDPPPVLWVRGDIAALAGPAVAVVGARRCSPYGLDQAGRFATVLAECGIHVVSGGARGIDAEAHRATMRAGGRTVAVLGSGLDRPYPPEHRRLFEDIVDAGGTVISEFRAGTSARPEFFPRRNRIVSGLSLGVLVIEARERSGASITARMAVEDHGREAMAVPGRADNAASAGCHRAIREGWAALVASPSELFETLAASGHLLRGATEKVAAASGDIAFSASSSVRGIAERLLAVGAAFSEDLAVDVPIESVLTAITMLELQGLVRRDADGRYRPSEALRSMLTRRVAADGL